ncbi:MAG: hypothetical protein H0S84_04605 [Bacteroidales bacterium]|jgi:hypothetical protein|nr:hypothetical protein [Bacteroidales bacterium]MDN5348819.1 hypothetical protein [Bacteroidales bacterium]
MKSVISFAGLLLLINLTSCIKDTSPDEDIPVFSYAEPVVNPPDKFMIVFNTSWVGDRFSTVEFDTSAVWLIEKLGDGRISLFISNDSVNLPVTHADTLGLRGAKEYTIIVNNVYTSEFNNFFVGFEKLDIAYESFDPKF